jgi:hypothetical protein
MDMEYNAKNYMAQGGDRLVIGGSLEILEGASVTGLPPATVSVATEETLGGVLAAVKTETDTVEAKIGEDRKLYIPPYTLPAADADTLGGVLLATNQAVSTATELAGLVTEFNTLLAALKAAGIMAVDESGES